MKRLILGGLAGAVVLFLWGMVSHMVLQLSGKTLKTIPNESLVLQTLRENIREPGLYFFPGMAQDDTLTAAQQEQAMMEWSEAYRRGPVGIMAYRPTGTSPFDLGLFLRQLVIDFIAAFIAAMILSLGRFSGFISSLIAVTLLGVFASAAVDFPYWNWYGFPTDYTVAVLFDKVIGWGLAGLAMAGIVRRG